MSTKVRWVTAAITVGLWVTWGVAYWASKAFKVGPLFLVVVNALMMLAGLSGIFLMLTYLVRPVIETARVWRDIGRREQERTCTCGQLPRKAKVNGAVIPFRTH